MACPNCKNPIKPNSNECEWCGINIVPVNNDINNQNIKLHNVLRFVFGGEWFLIDSYTEIYNNEILILKSTVKNGFNFEIENLSFLPIIKFIFPFKSKILELPQLDINKSYLIELEFSRMWGNYCSKPKSIKEIK